MKVYFSDNVFSFEKDEVVKNQKSYKQNYKIIQKGMKSNSLLSSLEECFLETKKVVLQKSLFKSFLNRIKKESSFIRAAGGVVITKDNHILFIYRHGLWDLPKGKKKKGESDKEAALREVREETGLKKIEILHKLTNSYHTYYLGNRFVLKKTKWYLMRANQESKLKPQKEEGITKVSWKNSSNLKSVYKNTFPMIKDILGKFLFKN